MSSVQPTPVDPHFANRQGMAALQVGDFAMAAHHFAAAVAADPDAIALWRNLAHARRELQDYEGERAALDAALAIDRTDFMVWLRKAELLQRLGETRDAFLAWTGVLQMAARLDPFPANLAPVLNRARAYVEDQSARVSAKIDTALAQPMTKLAPGEHRRARAFVDAATRGRRIYRNECAGVHYPFLPADEFFEESHFPWFADLAAAAPAIRRELEALLAEGDAALRPYVRLDAGTPDSKWSALDHSLDWGACFLWEYGAPNQPVVDRCPATAAALAAIPSAVIPGRSPSAFFSLLRPRTRIPAHTGVTNSRAIIHLPLIVPPGCGFRVGGETRQWVEGVPFAFDDTIEHEAWNDSDELRAVLILDVWNPHLTPAEQDMIVRYYAAADAAATDEQTS
jgi:aspartate beta-hydroxylase